MAKKKQSNKLIDLLSDEPAWNYSVSGITGSGMSVLANAKMLDQYTEEVFQKRLKEDNDLFEHFIATGEVVDKIPPSKK